MYASVLSFTEIFTKLTKLCC